MWHIIAIVRQSEPYSQLQVIQRQDAQQRGSDLPVNFGAPVRRGNAREPGTGGEVVVKPEVRSLKAC
jgi:hypothetical protein